MVSTIVVSMIVSVLCAIVSLLLHDLYTPTNNCNTSWIFRHLLKMSMRTTSSRNHSLGNNSCTSSSSSSNSNSSNRDANSMNPPQLVIETKMTNQLCNCMLQKRSRTSRNIWTHISHVICSLLLHQMMRGIQPTNATLYVNNNTYATLPALFGRYMVDGKTYEARLQYFHENPYLCDIDTKTIEKFVPPTGGIQINHFGGSNLTIYEESVALLVVRGNCPFQKKASIAELIHDSIKVLFIANFNLDNVPEEDETLVPMYSQFGDTRLVLLSISHATGQALKKYLSEMPTDITKLGGPIIQFDSVPPYGLLTESDLESMMFSALGIFFMLISFTGCLVILTGTYHQLLMNQNGGGNPLTAATQRRLLTEEEVQQFSASLTGDSEEILPSRTSSAISTLIPQYPGTNSLIETDETLNDVEADQCAVCLGEFDSNEDETITILPCHHKFHTTCITPWLTERQSKCPLCKFDVLQHIREQASATTSASPTSDTTPDSGDLETSAPTTTSASFWDQIRRHRWTSIATYNRDDINEPSQLQLDGVIRMVGALSNIDSIINYDDDDDDIADNTHRLPVRNTGNLEMTEQQHDVPLRTV